MLWDANNSFFGETLWFPEVAECAAVQKRSNCWLIRSNKLQVYNDASANTAQLDC